MLALNQSVLERRGYSVLTARSLAAVRQLLARKPRVDVAVLDIRLPDGNGLDFVPELRQTAPVPVLMLTSCRDYDDMVRGLTGGADDYMTKPYRIDELLARIAALLLKREPVHPPSEVVRGPDVYKRQVPEVSGQSDQAQHKQDHRKGVDKSPAESGAHGLGLSGNPGVGSVFFLHGADLV